MARLSSVVVSVCLLALVAVTPHTVFAQADTFTFTEDFSAGLWAWTPKVLDPFSQVKNDTPMIFDAANPPFGPNTGYDPAWGQVAGYASSLAIGDDTRGEWIQRQFPACVLPGSHTVTIELDLYVSWGCSCGDRYSVGNRVYVLTNTQYNNPTWDFDKGDPSPGFQKETWNGVIDGSQNWTKNGVWQHRTWSKTVNTTTGNFEVRLLQHDKYVGYPQAVAWDNVRLTIDGVEIMFEDFHNGLGEWTDLVYGHAYNDDPAIFFNPVVPFGPNTGRLEAWGQAAGYSSNMAGSDQTAGEWIQKQFAAALVPGEYNAVLEVDAYVYKQNTSDPHGVGNRMYVLTDAQYDNPTWDFDHGSLDEGFRAELWPGVPTSNNGAWQHIRYEHSFNTISGNIEIRLLQHDKTGGAQAVAWDNVSLTLTPVGAPAITSTSPLPSATCSQPYQYSFTGMGQGTLVWTLLSVTPPIASLAMDSSGVLTCTPVEAELGSHTVSSSAVMCRRRRRRISHWR
jgi:hypothetical protein